MNIDSISLFHILYNHLWGIFTHSYIAWFLAFFSCLKIPPAGLFFRIILLKYSQHSEINASTNQFYTRCNRRKDLCRLPSKVHRPPHNVHHRKSHKTIKKYFYPKEVLFCVNIYLSNSL